MAATFKPCLVDGCKKDASRASTGRAGYCRVHYNRIRRYGDPKAGPTFNGEPAEYFLNSVVPYTGAGCLFWPYGKDGDGYGAVRIDGKQRIVSRLTCELKNGPPPTPKHEAAHSCGNGHLGCVNPHHLSWKTSAENQADKTKHGTLPQGERHGSAKINDNQAREIIGLKGILPRSEIAKRYGLSPVTIGDIHRGKTWRNVR
jgi:hypothetical protein